MFLFFLVHKAMRATVWRTGRCPSNSIMKFLYILSAGSNWSLGLEHEGVLGDHCVRGVPGIGLLGLEKEGGKIVKTPSSRKLLFSIIIGLKTWLMNQAVAMSSSNRILSWTLFHPIFNCHIANMIIILFLLFSFGIATLSLKIRHTCVILCFEKGKVASLASNCCIGLIILIVIGSLARLL